MTRSSSLRSTLIISSVLALGALAFVPGVAADHSVKILTNPPGEGGDYTMRVEIEKFTLVPVGEKDTAEKGEGHIHYLLNGDIAPGDYATTSKTFTYRDLQPGDELTVELVHNDHSSYEPKVLATQTVGETEESPIIPTALVLGALLVGVAAVRKQR